MTSPASDIKWTTRDGDVIRLGDMTSDHLRNCIRLLERKATKVLAEGYAGLCFLQGEMAQEAAQDAIDMELEETSSWITSMELELNSRDEDY